MVSIMNAKIRISVTAQIDLVSWRFPEVYRVVDRADLRTILEK